MDPEIGHIALILAFVVAVLQAGFGLAGAKKGNARMMSFSDRAAIVQFVLIAFSFLVLMIAFIQSDFSVKLVADNSHTDKPLLYKISGVWGNHEGSILLWVLILALFGALIAIFGSHLPKSLRARALAVQAVVGVGFLAFMLLTSKPFARLYPVPANGQDLNPLLQDPGLAYHPPFLYLGYVGFSVAYSFSVAALLEGRVDAVWARWLRPWVLIAWAFLTIGITMGSIWAYYELGWGGWWMWDPVENVSFMPWLIGTALLHSILVLDKRHAMASWTILLGITAFSLALIGTFVVRSGVLVSVLAFAVDPTRGVVILALLAAFSGGALLLYAARAHTLIGGTHFASISKEGSLLANNLLLCAATATVFLGTFYPLIIEAFTDDKISVGAPYFDATFAPVMLLLAVIMGFGPLLPWGGAKGGAKKGRAKKGRASFKRIKKPMLILLAVGIVITVLVLVFGKSALGAMCFGIAAYLATGTLIAFARQNRFGDIPLQGSLKLLRVQAGPKLAFLLAHLGMACAIAGITAMSVWSADGAKVLKPGEGMDVAGYTFTLHSITNGTRDNYQYERANIAVSKNGTPITNLDTERRFFPVRGMVTSEAGIDVGLAKNLYVGLSEGNAEKGWVVRAYYHPLVLLIWIGAMMMALAGFIGAFGGRRGRKLSGKHQAH